MTRFGMLPRRLVHLVIIVFGITVVTFFLLRLIPGDPALAILGSSYTTRAPSPSTASSASTSPSGLSTALYMDQLFHGNLGFSFFYGESATTVIVSTSRRRCTWSASARCWRR